MSQVQEELFLFQLAFSGLIRQGKSQNTMLIDSCIFQNICFFEQWYLGCKSMSSACTAGRGYLSTPAAAEQEANENTEARSSFWQWWEVAFTYTLCPQPRCTSLAEFLWPFLSAHLPAHPGNDNCCQAAQVASVLASLWESSALPCWDRLSWMHCVTVWENP